MNDYDLKRVAKAEKVLFVKLCKRTNADRLRAMTDEELAERLAEIANDGGGSCAPGCYDCTEKTCASAWLDWLRQEVGNG